jgi:sugar diacid utilization regulator
LVNDDDAPYPRLIKTLVMRGIPVGVMVVTAYVRPLEEQDAELMELIASFIMPIIAKDRYFVSSNERTVENYFIKLLDGAKISSERVEKRLNLLEFNRTEYMYVLTICACQRSSQGNVPTIAQLIDRFRHLGCEEVFLYNAALVCVYRSDHDIVDWDNQEPGLTQILREEGLEAGVSRRIADLSDLREYYLQARNALSIGRRLGREATSYSRYDSLSAFLLFRNIPREELMNYCHQKIQRLAEYDDAHNMDLCVTLQVYLEQTKSLAKAADVLYIHRNTVRYRINKCMELMNTDLEDGNEIFAYILSLRIIEYQKKFPADGGEILDG